MMSRLRAHVLQGEPLYRNAHYLSVTVDVAPAAARRLLPFPLRLEEPARASLFAAWFPDNPFGRPYREAGLFLHVRLSSLRGIFCPWMVVDDSAAMVAGRELLGYPKKIADIAFDREGDVIQAHVSRYGRQILAMRAQLGGPVTLSPFLGRRHLNVHGNLGLRLPALLTFKPGEVPVSVRKANIDLTLFGESADDDLALIDPARAHSGRLHQVDIGLSVKSVPIPLIAVSPHFISRNDRLRNR